MPQSSRGETLARPTVGPLDLCWGLARRVVDFGVRRLTYAVARRRMRQIRRDPAALMTRLRHARSVLVVCHGNIIRSPFAAQWLRQHLGAAAPVSVWSAGLEAVPGRPPHPLALQLASRRGVDLADHTARRITPAAVAESDIILVMDVPQLVTLRKRFPEVPGVDDKTFLLGCLDARAPLEIDDPVDGDETVFQTCFNHISRAASPIARELKLNQSDLA